MNKLFKHIIFIFLAMFVCAGCQQPVGGFGNGNGSGGANDFILLKPNRQLYSLNSIFENTFNRSTDFAVYFANNGPLQKIDPLDADLKIEIISTVGFVGAEINEEVDSLFYFAIPGRYKVIGTYLDKTDEYSIEVQGNFSDPGEGSEFAGIKWLD
ncbi:MAG: hypothetical protein FWB95_09760 [Treponema sp.]|nr:hypothetical protein [Treponema sp.]